MQKEQGIVLLTVLLFLVVITVLVLAALNTSLLETKIDSNYYAKMQSFYATESKLRLSEQALLNNKQLGDAELIQHTDCVDFYRVIVNEENGKQALQSFVAKVDAKCESTSEVQPGRQSWGGIF